MTDTGTEVRPELPPMPQRIDKLPRERGYPVPWFVAWIDGHADFRVLAPGAVVKAVRDDLCFICGERMGRFRAWPIGPMCVVNRNTAEPPSHYECAVWACKACPFLARPHARRRENSLPGDATEPDGVMIRRNPGCIAVWVTEGVPARRALRRHGEVLFDVGTPVRVEWLAEGREATREEVEESINSGLPLLQEYAAKQPGGERALAKEFDRAMTYLPAA